MITILLQKILAALTQLLGDVKTKLNTIKTNLDNLIVMATASGPIASFTTTIIKPFISCKVEIKPKQASGTPTPSNPLPISGTDTVVITQTGKNLINWKVDTTNYEFDLPSGNYVMSWVSALPNGIWYFRGTDAQGNYYTDKTALGLSASWSHSSTTHYNYATISVTNFVFSVPVGCSKLEIFRQNTDGTIDCQVEIGSTATTYEPYTATTKTVSLPETVYGGDVDVIGGSGENTWGEVDLSQVQYTTTSWGGYKITIDNCKPFAGESVATCLASKYATTSYNDLNTNKPNNSIAIATTGNVYLVSDNPPTGQFVFELATPTPITLANPIELTAKAGVNNVFGDTDGNTSVEYLKLCKEA